MSRALALTQRQAQSDTLSRCEAEALAKGVNLKGRAIKDFTEAMTVDPEHIVEATLFADTARFSVRRVPLSYKVRAKQRWKTDGWVYFIRSDRYVKIGFAKEVGDRLPKLQTGSATELTLLLALEKPASAESGYQQRFAKLRARGEWFHLSGGLLDFLERYYRSQKRARWIAGKTTV